MASRLKSTFCPRLVLRPIVLSALALACIPTAAVATVINLIADADTAISAAYPDDNYGDSTLGVGANGVGMPFRSLVEFDLSSIPAGAIITDAEVTMTVVKVPPGDQHAGPISSDFQIYRMLVPWTEGSGGGNSGSPALAGETTWDERGALGVATWGQPGGQIGADFANAPSTSTSIGVSTGPVVWGSTPAFVSDVQLWLDDPSQNFGFIVISDGESTAGTARRLASRESASGSDIPPTLALTYTVPEPGCALLCLLGGTLLVARRSPRLQRTSSTRDRRTKQPPAT